MKIERKDIYEYITLCNNGYSNDRAFNSVFNKAFDDDTHDYIIQLDKIWKITERIAFINNFKWKKACQRTIFENINIKIMLLKDLCIRFVLSNDQNCIKLSAEICKMMALYDDNHEIKNALDTVQINFRDLKV